MHSMLTQIYDTKKVSVEQLKKERPLELLKEQIKRVPPLRDFCMAVSRKDRINIIAEIKKASPSAGTIRGEINPARIAEHYAAAGAAAVSVLTEEKYFQGDLSYLLKVKKSATLPVLRKDFIFDTYQVYESAAAGADAILLIAAMLDVHVLNELVEFAFQLGLDCLLEVHGVEDLAKALQTPAQIIGINTRDLNDFTINMKIPETLLPKIPKGKIIIVESGIRGADDIRRFAALGIQSFLVGESLMRSDDARATLQDLKGAMNG